MVDWTSARFAIVLMLAWSEFRASGSFGRRSITTGGRVPTHVHVKEDPSTTSVPVENASGSEGTACRAPTVHWIRETN
jgi:hypothetical protein